MLDVDIVIQEERTKRKFQEPKNGKLSYPQTNSKAQKIWFDDESI